MRPCTVQLLTLLQLSHSQRRLMTAVEDFINEGAAPAERMIRDLVACEHAYINTDHPSFVGGNRAIAQVPSFLCMHVSMHGGHRMFPNNRAWCNPPETHIDSVLLAGRCWSSGVHPARVPAAMRSPAATAASCRTADQGPQVTAAP
jgi:Dynamin central region